MQLGEAARGRGPGSGLQMCPDVGVWRRGLVAVSPSGFEEPRWSRACLHPEHHLRHPGAGTVWAFISDKKAAIVEKTEWNNKKGSLQKHFIKYSFFKLNNRREELS